MFLPVLGASVLGPASNDLVTMTTVDSAPDTLLSVTHDTLLRSETSEERGMTGVSVSLSARVPVLYPPSLSTVWSPLAHRVSSSLDSARMVRV